MQVAGLANIQEPAGTVSDKGSSQQGERVIRPAANGILHPSILRLFRYGLSAHTRILNQSKQSVASARRSFLSDTLCAIMTRRACRVKPGNP
jgi:hypothetical protein